MPLSTGCIYISSNLFVKCYERLHRQNGMKSHAFIMQIGVQSLLRTIVIELGRLSILRNQRGNPL